MNHIIRTFSSITVLIAAAIFGYSSGSSAGEDTTTRASRDEHDRDGGEDHGNVGEESGTEFELAEEYDRVRNGTRLILACDPTINSFKGTVENTTTEALERVRVEVHLSNGKELGPTTPTGLEPGEKKGVELKATSPDFDGWTYHPEIGSSEHGHGGEHGE